MYDALSHIAMTYPRGDIDEPLARNPNESHHHRVTVVVVSPTCA